MEEIMEAKKIRIPSEIIYVLAVVILAFSVCLATAADFGVSMIVAPAYILSIKFPVLTFGQWEYVTQGILFIIFCLIMRRFHWTYLVSFFTCLFYGAVLDLWRLIPIFNPNVTVPGSFDLWLRIVFFVVGIILTSFSIALFNRCYICPQVVDLVPQGICRKFNFKFAYVKYVFDGIYLTIGLTLSLIFFGNIVGLSFGTAIMFIINGFFISFCMEMLDKVFEFTPAFKKFAKQFEEKKEENPSKEQ